MFADRKAYARYVQARALLGELRIEIEGSPAFHALHWEALKDPELPRAFALESAMVRRRRAEQPIEADVKPAPALRLLIVTARPHGTSDVSYRTISRPLVACLRQAGVRVDIDILRPGTYHALDQHLQDMSQRHGSGFYHLVHFDTHGALLSFNQLGTDTAPSTGAVLRRYGRATIAPYEGKKAFLFLEGEGGDEADPVEASELARLLTVHQIPIVILNACQSGKEVGISETSLGSRLIEGGVQMVLAMSYSVTVSAAELVMSSLYRQLFDGEDVANAMRRARQALFNEKERRAYYNHTIQLEDWLLPVAYQNQPVRLARREFTVEEERLFYERQAAAFSEPETAYGFFGRDLDVLTIERRLLRRNVLLVRGMGGAGKTTLLRHLGHWWQSTDFVAEVFYFGYDTQGWTRQRILHDIARGLLSETDYHTRFVPLSLAAQQQKLAELLRAKRHLLILDNLESITGTHLAISQGLAKEEQTALAEFLKRLTGGRSLVLLGSRAGETWLAPGTFSDNVYELGGLDPEAASQLAEQILERHQATHHREDGDFERLLALLDGFPLALEVVLPNLRQKSPTTVLKALQEGGALDTGTAEDKTRSILRCIEYSHSNVSPEAQQLLECLAPFSGAFNTQRLAQYTRTLQGQPPLADLPFERWPEVLKEATDWGLLSPHPEFDGFLILQPVLPYFLRQRLAEADRGARREAIESAFREHYEDYARTIAEQMGSNAAEERRLGTQFSRLEYENLLNALHLGLVAHASIGAVYHALSTYVDAVHDDARMLALSELVVAELERYPAAVLSSEIGIELVGVLHSVGYAQLNLNRVADAHATSTRALDLLLRTTALAPEDIRRMSATIYHQLGRVAHAQREWGQAQHYYEQALEIEIEFGARSGQASTYHELGMVAQKEREWLQAEQCYQQALAITIELNDRYGQSHTYLQLSRVAWEQHRWPEAEQHCQQALAICIEFNDRYFQAGIYRQLGLVAQAQGQWTQAGQYYQEALAIEIEFGDRRAQASTYHQLGRVSQAQRELPQAEQYYQQAVAIFVEFNDRYRAASSYHQLGTVAQEQGQWTEAERYNQRALEFRSELNDRSGEAMSYHHLGRVAQDQRQWSRAEQYFRQALAIYDESGDRCDQAGMYHQLGTVAQQQSEWSAAEQYYKQALAIYVDCGDQYGQARTSHQLGKLAQEQRHWREAEVYYHQALRKFIELGDKDSAALVILRFAGLWRASGDASLPARLAETLGLTEADALSILESTSQDQG